MYWIASGASLKGSNYYWLHSLKRNPSPGFPHGWKWWRWEFVRPDHAFLSKRGWVIFKEEWLPPGTERREIVYRPIPDIIEYEEAPCAILGCGC